MYCAMGERVGNAEQSRVHRPIKLTPEGKQLIEEHIGTDSPRHGEFYLRHSGYEV